MNTDEYNYNTDLFIHSVENLGIHLSERQLMQFMRYYELLVDGNKKINLTAITEFDDVMMKHFADSAAFFTVVEPKPGQKLIDVGTGAGFPGIPIKILCPELKVTLLDSLNKRIRFLETVIEELKLENIEAVHMRAEDAGKDPGYREQYDYCVSRAVADLAVLSEYCVPLVKKNGIFLAYKSAGSEAEIQSSKNGIRKLNARITSIKDIELKYGDNKIERKLIEIKKIDKTPEQYPRKAGIPSKRPLK